MDKCLSTHQRGDWCIIETGRTDIHPVHHVCFGMGYFAAVEPSSATVITLQRMDYLKKNLAIYYSEESIILETQLHILANHLYLCSNFGKDLMEKPLSVQESSYRAEKKS